MERQGLVKLGTGKLPKNFWRMPRPKDPKGLVMKGMLEDRAELSTLAASLDHSDRVRHRLARPGAPPFHREG